MKRFLIFAIMVLFIAISMMPVCFAEEALDSTETSGELSYSEKEEIVKDVLDGLLAKGSEVFAGMEWWEVLSTWVKANFDAVMAFGGGFLTVCGVLYYIFRSNPKLKQYINSIGTSCKVWFEKISTGIDGLVTSSWSVTTETTKTNEKIDRLTTATLLLVDAFEDVVKLSGADEGKKEIYISTIETAKRALNEKSVDVNKESGDSEV